MRGFPWNRFMASDGILEMSGGPPSPVFEPAPGDRKAWLAADIGPSDGVVRLDDAARAEIRSLTDDPQSELPPRLAAAMAAVKARLDDFPGFALVDGLPLDELTEDEAASVFLSLGRALGRPVPQKWDGSLVYHVRDTGQAYGPGVRGSYTNVELVFHTDNAFGVAQPDTVGLLCLRPAKEGGISRFCSLLSVHQRLRDRDPAALARLYRPLLWDRQGEHAEGAPPVARAPMFRARMVHNGGRRLIARANVSLVRKGYERAGLDMDGETAEALAALEAVTADPALWFEMPLARGQLQYLNNRDLAHYRSHFVDADDPAGKRHLVRTWHRDWGGPGYDG